jgi:hypothetical protein
MNNNCYYSGGKSSTFSDRRPASILSNAGLAARKVHIVGVNRPVAGISGY